MTAAVATTMLDSLDPRVRVVTLLLFALVVVFSPSLAALTTALLIGLILGIWARLPLRRTLRQLLTMDLFILVLLLMLPFTLEGTPLVQIGPLSASQEGALQVLVIALKANAVLLAMLALVSRLEGITFGHALARLGAPDKLVHLLMFTLRYIDLIQSEFRRMREAMMVRGFRPASNLHTLRSLGYLVGMLLVRSLERAERVVEAMKCRGFNGSYHLIDEMRLARVDHLFLAAGGGALLLLLAINLL